MEERDRGGRRLTGQLDYRLDYRCQRLSDGAFAAAALAALPHRIRPKPCREATTPPAAASPDFKGCLSLAVLLAPRAGRETTTPRAMASPDVRGCLSSAVLLAPRGCREVTTPCARASLHRKVAENRHDPSCQTAAEGPCRRGTRGPFRPLTHDHEPRKDSFRRAHPPSNRVLRISRGRPRASGRVGFGSSGRRESRCPGSGYRPCRSHRPDEPGRHPPNP
jgi:hypothetical protein